MKRALALSAAAVLATAIATVSAAERPDPEQVQARAADRDFGVAAKALVLRRTVEMYQWQEIERGELPEYVREWSETPIDSSAFVLPQGHANPPMPFRSARFPATEVRYRGAPVDAAAWASVGTWQPLEVDLSVLPPNLAASLQPGDGGLTSSRDPAQPQVGDVRVRWSIIPVSALPALEQRAGAWVAPGTAASVDAIPGLPDRGGAWPGLWIALATLLLVVLALVWFGRRPRRRR